MQEGELYMFRPLYKHVFAPYTAVGDTVKEDEVVCEIETDKVHKYGWGRIVTPWHFLCTMPYAEGLNTI